MHDCPIYFLRAAGAGRPIRPIRSECLEGIVLELVEHANWYNLDFSEEYPDFYKLANQTFGAVEEEITEHRVRNFAMYVLDCAPSDITFLTNDDLYGPKRKLAEVGICQDYINQAQPFLGEWAQEAIDEGMSIAQVADLVGTTWPRIKRYITKLQESDKA